MRQQSRRQAGSKPRFHRRARPCLEEMEKRLLLSVSASLLKDLNLQPASSNPANLLTINGITYFSANDGVHGKELWRTNGTSAGTYMVKDINPNGDSDPTDLVNVNGRLLFQTGIYHEQLWVSDGTAAGTKVLRIFDQARPAGAVVGDITLLGNLAVFIAGDVSLGTGIWRTDGTSSGTYQISKVENVTGFTVVNGVALFAGSDQAHGVELWRTNGFGPGTNTLMDINPGPASSNPFDFTRTGNLVFFAADDGVHGQEAWRSDGTAAGTFLVGGPISDLPYQGFGNRFTAADNLVFFNNRDYGPLWISDGSVAGTHQVFGGPSGNDPQFANFITASSSVIYYESLDFSDLWRSDGTVAGTYQVSSVNYYAGLGTVNGLFIFLGDTDGRHSTELWATDGTSGGTVLLQHIATGSSNLFVRIEPQPYITWGSNVYVSVFGPIDIEPGAKGLGFWKTDGTPAGTSELSSAVVGSLFAYGNQIFLANGRLLFAATDADNSTQLWSSNGTSSGTALLKDINPGTLGESDSDSIEGHDRFVGMNGAIYFTTLNTAPDIGGNLWKTNGSAAGTTLVTQLPYPGVFDLTVFGNMLYFITDSYPLQIWKSDGTAAGTVPVTDPLSSSQPLYPGDLTAFNGTLYFLAGADLWKTDGTESGTVPVTSFGTDPGGVSIYSLLAASHSSLYFEVEDYLKVSPTQFQLWKSDGTTAGTTLLQTLGPNAPTTPDLFVMNGQLYYSSDADGQGWQLWKTNGTPAGTKLVKVLLPGANAYPTNFTNVNGVLYFTANDGTGGTALWRSDGTTAGTKQLADFSSQGSVLLDLTNVNGTLFFDTDSALWKSDGTQAGTVFVADIGKPALYQFSRQVTALDGMLFFQADDGLHGRALWESDGTAAGTFMVPGIRKEGGCQPGALTVLWNRLFFIADDGIHGFEPWTLTVTPTPATAFFESSVSALPRSSDANPVAQFHSHAPSDMSFETASARPSASSTALSGVRFLARQSPKDVDILFTLGWDQDR